MSTQVQYRRGTATQNNSFTGALAEITVDTTNWTLRVHDGVSAGGGGNIATVAYVTAQLAALSANAITFGTSNVQIPSSGSNVRVNVGGTSNVAVFTTTGVEITGDLSVSGNATLSGNILGDRVQNGTTSIDIQTPSGNANISIGGTSNVAVFSTAGMTINGGITNGGANGVGNIGSSTTYFNTVFAKATSAQYADLAEMYQGDESYMPGTVVEFGGTHEVTITTTESSTRIAGVVSTNPSYLMNSGLDNLNAVPVALTGRVPCQVLGPVKKGDRLVSSVFPGVAQALDNSTYQPGCMIGKSLEDWSDASVKLIEVVVGRL
jgi:hypothetical protein